MATDTTPQISDPGPAVRVRLSDDIRWRLRRFVAEHRCRSMDHAIGELLHHVEELEAARTGAPQSEGPCS